MLLGEPALLAGRVCWFQKNLARWKHWQPRTADSDRRRQQAFEDRHRRMRPPHRRVTTWPHQFLHTNASRRPR